MYHAIFWTHIISLVHSARLVVIPCTIAQWLSIYLSSSPLQDMIHHDASAVATATTVAQCQFFRFLFRDLLFFDIHITAIVLKPYHSFFCMHPLLSIMANREKIKLPLVTRRGLPVHHERISGSAHGWLQRRTNCYKVRTVGGLGAVLISSTVLGRAWRLSSQTSWKEQLEIFSCRCNMGTDFISGSLTFVF